MIKATYLLLLPFISLLVQLCSLFYATESYMLPKQKEINKVNKEKEGKVWSGIQLIHVGWQWKDRFSFSRKHVMVELCFIVIFCNA